MKRRFLSGLVAILLGTFACRPVIAVGWEEFLLLGILMAFLLGPPIYKFWKKLENLRGHKKNDR